MLATQRPTLTSLEVAFAEVVHVVSPSWSPLTLEVSLGPRSGRLDGEPGAADGGDLAEGAQSAASRPVAGAPVGAPRVHPRRRLLVRRGPPPWPPRMPPVHEPSTGGTDPDGRRRHGGGVCGRRARPGIAATQSPTFRSFAAAVTCWVKVVFAVQVTATWPPCPWTCAVEPDTAATLPEPPGNAAAGPAAGRAALAVLLGDRGGASATVLPGAAGGQGEPEGDADDDEGKGLLHGCSLVGHSLRSASMGVSRAARLAG